MDIIDTKAIKLVRRWQDAPRSASDTQVIEVMGQSLWFAMLRLKISLRELFRPLRKVTRMLLRRLPA
jgi:hypothetical protein